MPNPWDVPPYPKGGNDEADDVYKTVGRVLTEWEELEYQLSHLYSVLVERPAQIAAIREYGVPRTFSDRATELTKAADGFWIPHPNQKREGELQALVGRIRLFADRRNDIAHSVVRPLQWLRPLPAQYKGLTTEPSEYAAVPALNSDRKFDPQHLPKYIYTTTELERFVMEFFDLAAEVLRLKLAIERERQP